MKRHTLLSAIAITFGLLAGSAKAFTIQILVDNDFAIFGGTSTEINEVLYQNDTSWGPILTRDFALKSGNTTFYVLAMGGGGQENISGKIDGVNMTALGTVSMSQDISRYLTGYRDTLYYDPAWGGEDIAAVENGTYNALLTDIQTAFANVVWGAPVINTTDIVIGYSGFGSGFSFDDKTARLFSFTADHVTAVPEPSSFALLGIGLAGLAAARKRRQQPIS